MLDIEKELQIIKERNQRVEMDKAWEVSWTRRLFIVVLTYVVASVWLVLINETIWYLKAFVPVAGYILSTLSLSAVKQWWTGKASKNVMSIHKKTTIKIFILAVIIIVVGVFAWLFRPRYYATSDMQEITYPTVSEAISQASQANAPTEFVSSRINTNSLPAAIYAAQLEETIKIKDVLFQLVAKPDVNHLITLPAEVINGREEPWGGILASTDDGNSWESFYKIKDPITLEAHNTWGTLVYNPAGLFVADGKLYLDLTDDIGGGSGEGRMSRLVSADAGQSWQTAGCYYFIPELYYKYTAVDNLDTPLTDKEGINPRALKETTGCLYRPK